MFPPPFTFTLFLPRHTPTGPVGGADDVPPPDTLKSTDVNDDALFAIRETDVDIIRHVIILTHLVNLVYAPRLSSAMLESVE